MILTIKEKRVLRLLAASLREEYSINDVSRKCHITPNGAYKILVKLEKEGIVKTKPIANIKAYRLDFSSEKTTCVLELAFIPDVLPGRVKIRGGDLQPMKPVTQACILFGSYITPKKEPEDLDVLFVVQRGNFEAYKRALTRVQDITPVKIQDIVQTTEDLNENIKKSDPIIAEALRNGMVLWGFAVLVEEIKNASQ